MPKMLTRAWFTLLLLLTACGPLADMVVELTLTGVPAGATQVRVDATLNGTAATSEMVYNLPSGTDTSYHVSVELQPPPAAGSALVLTATAADGTGTICAAGSGEPTLSGQASVPLTIALTTCPQWRPVTPPATGLPQPPALTQIWGFSADDIWTVGEMGTALHFDGSAWSSYAVTTMVTLRGVWGSAPSDVWTVGDEEVQGMGKGRASIQHFTGALPWIPSSTSPASDLNGVWGSSSTNIWGVGAAGAVSRYDGTQWAAPLGQDADPPTTQTLYQVFGGADGTVYAVGDMGTVVSYHALVPIAGTAGTTASLRGVWVSPLGVVWAVGASGTIVARANPLTPWVAAKIDGTISATLNGIWGIDDRDIWAVGELGADGMGTLLHWDGESWKSAPGGGDQPLSSVWASSSADVWAVGAAGTILHFSREP